MSELDRIDAVDALSGLRALPDGCIDCVLTSPPYWGARDDGVAPVRWGEAIERYADLARRRLAGVGNSESQGGAPAADRAAAGAPC